MNMSYWSSDQSLSYQQFRTSVSEIISALNIAQCDSPDIFVQEYYDVIRLVYCTDEDMVSKVRVNLGIENFSQENALIVFKKDGVRVELHGVKDTEYEFALKYLSFDSAGSIPGKMLHHMGMKLSSKGLFYLIRENMFDGDSQNTHIMEEVLLTNKWGEALGLLSIKDTDWATIQSREDLFTLIANSREFCPSIFKEFLEEKGDVFDTSGRADIFVRFCRWVVEQGYPHKGYRPKRVYRKALCELYLGLKNRMFANSGKYLRKREIHKRLNAENIKQWCGLDAGDNRIGGLIRFVKSKHDELEILSMPTVELRALLINYLPYANP